jgi:hypothetical protein
MAFGKSSKPTPKFDRFMNLEVNSGTATKEEEEAVRADIEQLLMTLPPQGLHVHEILSHVPEVTNDRWWKALRCKGEKANLSSRIVELLRHRPDVFRIVREMGEDSQMNYHIQLAAAKRGSFIGEGMCLKLQTRRSPWVNVLQQLLALPATVNRLRKLWGVQFDSARLEAVARAMEKSYSKLQGPRAYAGQQSDNAEVPGQTSMTLGFFQPSSPIASPRESVTNLESGSDPLGDRLEPWASGKRRPQAKATPVLGFIRGSPRGSFMSQAANDKLNHAKFAQWINAVLLEEDVDQDLEWGESVARLCSSICKRFKSRDSVGGSRRTSRTHRASYEDRTKEVDFEGGEGIEIEAFVSFCKLHYLTEGEVAIGESQIRKAFNQALKIHNDAVNESSRDLDAPTLTQCSPVLLSLLLHFLAQRGHVKYDSFVLELLWKQCGWGFPIARRCIRQFKGVYDRFAEHGTLRPRRIRMIFQEAGLEPPTAQEVTQANCDGTNGTGIADLLLLVQQYTLNRRHPTPLQVLMQICEHLKE